MMKTVAFLLLLSSTNAARSDNLIPSDKLSQLSMQLSQEHDQVDQIEDDQFSQGVEQIDEQEISEIIPDQLSQQEEQQEEQQQDEEDNREKLTLFRKFKKHIGNGFTATKAGAKTRASAAKAGASTMASKVRNGFKIRASAAKAGASTMASKVRNGFKIRASAAKNGVVRGYGATKEVGTKALEDAKSYGQIVNERSTKLVGLVKAFQARAIVAAVVLAFLWVAVPWFIVRQIVEWITSPRAGVISALVTMFVAIPVALIVVLLHDNTYGKVVEFLDQPLFGKKDESVAQIIQSESEEN